MLVERLLKVFQVPELLVMHCPAFCTVWTCE